MNWYTHDLLIIVKHCAGNDERGIVRMNRGKTHVNVSD